MAKRRLAVAATAVVVVAAVLVASPDVAAQPSSTVTAGAWEGTLSFGGSMQVQTTVAGRVITDWRATPTVLPVQLEVNDEGVITSGTAKVDLDWNQTGTGSDPDGNPFHVTSEHDEDGALDVSGTIERMVVE